LTVFTHFDSTFYRRRETRLTASASLAGGGGLPLTEAGIPSAGPISPQVVAGGTGELILEGQISTPINPLLDIELLLPWGSILGELLEANLREMLIHENSESFGISPSSITDLPKYQRYERLIAQWLPSRMPSGLQIGTGFPSNVLLDENESLGFSIKISSDQPTQFSLALRGRDSEDGNRTVVTELLTVRFVVVAPP
jgi:hypothetical protein